MNNTYKKTSVAIVCALIASGCATGTANQAQNQLKAAFASDDPCSNNSRNIGVTAGAVIGGLLGKSMGDGKTGSVLGGAAIGALLGGFIGSDMDRRRCDLSKVAKAHNLDIQMTDITFTPPAPGASAAAMQTGRSMGPNATHSDTPQTSGTVGMSVTVFDRGTQFLPGSAKPSQAALKAYSDLADKYAAVATGTDASTVQQAKERNRKMRILLIGHTDDTGSSQANADLSEERARAIARVFAQHGFESSQLYYQGAGEVFPIADNHTEEGRARNRRVEIVDLSDDATFEAFLASRQPNLALYRPAPAASAGARPTPSTVESSAVRKNGGTSAKTAGREKDNDARAPKMAGADSGQAPRYSQQKETVLVPVPSASPVQPTPVASAPSGGGATPTKAAVARSETTGTAAIASTVDTLDFGGKIINGDYKQVDIGNPIRSGGFSLLSPAYASAKPTLSSCAADRPRISNRVKSLDDGQNFKTSAYLPGTASSSWSGLVNGHLVGLTGVAVLRDGAQPAGRPVVLVWKNWVDGSKAKPMLKATADVNTYQGDKALLYRVFPNEGPVRCLDVVIPASAPATAPESTLVYEHAKAIYQASYSPAIAR